MHNEKLVDQLDLIINAKRPLGKVTQETARAPQISLYHSSIGIGRTF